MADIVKIILDGKDQSGPAFKSARANLVDLNKVAAGAAAALTAATASVAAYFIDLSKRAIDAQDEFSKLSQKTGMATEFLSGLAHAADLAGLDITDTKKALKEFNNSIVAGDPAFKKLGISVRDTFGNLKGNEELFLQTAEAFQKMQDGAEKSALAAKIFGNKIGPELIPLLDGGRQGILAMSEEARKLGLTIHGDAAKSAEEFNDSLSRIKSLGFGVANTFTQEITPSLAELTKTVSEWIIKNEVAIKTAKLLVAQFKIIALEAIAVAIGFEQVSAIVKTGLNIALNNLLITSQMIDGLWKNMTATVTKFGEAGLEVVKGFVAMQAAQGELLKGDVAKAWHYATKALEAYGKGVDDGLDAVARQAIGNTAIVAKGAAALWNNIEDTAAKGFEELMGKVQAYAGMAAKILSGAKGSSLKTNTENNVTNQTTSTTITDLDSGNSMESYRLEQEMQAGLLDGVLKLKAEEALRFQDRLTQVSGLNVAEIGNFSAIELAYREHGKRMEQIDKDNHKTMLRNFAQYADGFAGISGSLASLAQSLGKKNAGLYKSMMYGQAIMSTAAGAARALADWPWPYSLVAVAAVVAAGAAQIATISKTPAAGQAHAGLGYVPSENTYVLSQGERVLAPKQNQDLTNFLEGNEQSGSGGGVMNQTQIFLDGREILRFIHDASRNGTLTINPRAIREGI
jgi:hypothetical protein